MANPDPATTTLSLTGFLWPSALENQLTPALSAGKLKASVVIDLRKVEFIHLRALMLLLSLISRFAKKQRPVSIKLPESARVNEFLAAWDFLPALEHVLALPEAEFLCSTSRQASRQASNPAQNRYMYARDDEDGVLSRLYSNRFFAIQTFSRQMTISNVGVAVNVMSRWREALVERVLTRMMPAGPQFFRARIIFEAMMNALQHPNARAIHTASAVMRDTRGSWLSVGFWDDGVRIPATLRAALSRGRRIQGSAFGTVDCEYWRYPSFRRFLASEPPHLGWSESELLLASTFPGVTCDPEGISRVAAVDSPPGMGLYYIANAAATVLGGKLIVRTGRDELTLKRSTRISKRAGEVFTASVKTRAMSNWIDGNLVWIEVPLRPRVDESRAQQ